MIFILALLINANMIQMHGQKGSAAQVLCFFQDACAH